MLHFTLFRIPIRVDPFFWVTMAFLGGAFSIVDTHSLLLTCMWVLAAFLSVLIHELGHSLSGLCFNNKSYIILHGFGGIAQFEKSFSKWQQILVSLNGPLLQAVMGIIVWQAFQASPLSQNETPGFHFFHTFLLASLFWASINLLPIWPLDGGKILESLLGSSRQKYTHWVSLVFCLLILFVLLLLNIHSLLILIFVFLFAWQNFSQIRLYK